ncbi:unnamed protein product, partial [Symbiodinium natans]
MGAMDQCEELRAALRLKAGRPPPPADAPAAQAGMVQPGQSFRILCFHGFVQN